MSENPFDVARSLADGEARANIDLIEQFFAALDRMDFAAVGALFTVDGLYRDTPVAPDADARGPEAIEQKLQLGVGGLDGFDTGVARLVAQGNTVMSERVEVWHLPTGEKPALPVMAVHEILGGKIASWREYWDMPSFTNQLPPSWLEEMGKRQEG
jgi:limonene-1,2-epoxide hydrolase